MRHCVALLFIVATSLLCSGCGSGDQVSVEGVITLDGQPLAGAQVTFDQPELGPKENKGYIGRTDDQGHYVLRPMRGEDSGVSPGKYRVLLTTAVLDPNAPAPTTRPAAGSTTIFFPESPPPPPERIPPAYRGGKLTFEVPSGGTTSADFKLVSK